MKWNFWCIMRKSTKSANPASQQWPPLSEKELNEIPSLGLVIPCRPGKPDRLEPIYRVKLNEFGGVERGSWQCAKCGKIFRTRYAWRNHSGLISNIMGDCPGKKQ